MCIRDRHLTTAGVASASAGLDGVLLEVENREGRLARHRLGAIRRRLEKTRGTGKGLIVSEGKVAQRNSHQTIHKCGPVSRVRVVLLVSVQPFSLLLRHSKHHSLARQRRLRGCG